MDGFNNFNFDTIQWIKSDMKKQFEKEEETHKEEEIQWLKTFSWEVTIETEEMQRKDIEEPMLSIEDKEYAQHFSTYRQK
jgi:hypothetical protein